MVIAFERLCSDSRALSTRESPGHGADFDNASFLCTDFDQNGAEHGGLFAILRREYDI